MLEYTHKLIVIIFIVGYIYILKEMWLANDWFGMLVLTIIISSFVGCSIHKFKREYDEKEN